MTDAELRTLVREAVARHLGPASAGPAAGPAAATMPAPRPPAAASPWQHHPSHHLYLSIVNADAACVIEPSVNCDHCGFCKSHGH